MTIAVTGLLYNHEGQGRPYFFTFQSKFEEGAIALAFTNGSHEVGYLQHLFAGFYDDPDSPEKTLKQLKVLVSHPSSFLWPHESDNEEIKTQKRFEVKCLLEFADRLGHPIDLARQSLIYRLREYRNDRAKKSERGLFGGFTKTEKISSVSKLIEALDSNESFKQSTFDLAIQLNGTLSECINCWEKDSGITLKTILARPFTYSRINKKLFPGSHCPGYPLAENESFRPKIQFGTLPEIGSEKELLIEVLVNYIKNRSRDQNEYRYGVFFGGYSRTEKLGVAQKISDLLLLDSDDPINKAEITFTDLEKKILMQGRLGKAIKHFESVTERSVEDVLNSLLPVQPHVDHRFDV